MAASESERRETEIYCDLKGSVLTCLDYCCVWLGWSVWFRGYILAAFLA